MPGTAAYVSVFSSVRSYAAPEGPIGAKNANDRGKYSSTARRVAEDSRTTSTGPWSRTSGGLRLN